MKDKSLAEIMAEQVKFTTQTLIQAPGDVVGTTDKKASLLRQLISLNEKLMKHHGRGNAVLEETLIQEIGGLLARLRRL